MSTKNKLIVVDLELSFKRPSMLVIDGTCSYYECTSARTINCCTSCIPIHIVLPLFDVVKLSTCSGLFS